MPTLEATLSKVLPILQAVTGYLVSDSKHEPPAQLCQESPAPLPLSNLREGTKPGVTATCRALCRSRPTALRGHRGPAIPEGPD